MTVKTKYTRVIHPKCGKTVTEQHHAKTCNINHIINKYQKTGLVEHVNRHQANYGDVSSADFETAVSLVKEQETVFNELPSSVRKHYDNDVVQYLEHIQTEDGALEHQNLLNPLPEVPETQKTAPEASQEPQKDGEQESKPVT